MEQANFLNIANVNRIIAYAAHEQMCFNRHMENLSGYKAISTFYSDLSIAECFDTDAIRDTYANVVREWGMNCEMFTEFILSLNTKIWEHYENKNIELATFYSELWDKAVDHVYEKWSRKKKMMDYYYSVAD